jgi:hypothetical protein
MKKFALYLTAFLTLIVYFLACSESFMKSFTAEWDNRGKPQFLHLDKYKYGDLYGLSYLRKFKIPTNGKLYADDRIAPGGNQKDIDLWMIGDSFLAYAFKPEDGAPFLYKTRLRYFWWELNDKTGKEVYREEGKLNVLIIETTERFVRDKYGSEQAAEKILSRYQIRENGNQENSNDRPPAIASSGDSEQATLRSRLESLTEKKIVPENFSQNIEKLLFGYEFFAPLKEAKSELNYRLFGRTAPLVYVSRNGENLFYSKTVYPAWKESSFRPVTDEELKEIVKNMNIIRDRYRKKGFDEVFFSLLPNPVTMIDPGIMPYSNLIPRLQNHPELKDRFIDVYSKMKTIEKPEDLFWRNDSHWNSNGFRLWVDQANKKLEEFANAKASTKE